MFNITCITENKGMIDNDSLSFTEIKVVSDANTVFKSCGMASNHNNSTSHHKLLVIINFYSMMTRLTCYTG